MYFFVELNYFLGLNLSSKHSQLLQMLTIHLGQDENDCFSAWVSAKEAGLAENDAIDQKGDHCLFINNIRGIKSRDF